MCTFIKSFMESKIAIPPRGGGYNQCTTHWPVASVTPSITTPSPETPVSSYWRATVKVRIPSGARRGGFFGLSSAAFCSCSSSVDWCGSPIFQYPIIHLQYLGGQIILFYLIAGHPSPVIMFIIDLDRSGIVPRIVYGQRLLNHQLQRL